MTPGLRESFKGFWSRPNRQAAWAWACEAFATQSVHSAKDSIPEIHFAKPSLRAAFHAATEENYARNQTKEL